MKSSSNLTRVFAAILCLAMLCGMLPLAVAADGTAETKFANSQLSLVQDKQSALASGVTQNIYTVYDKNGKQVKMFAATIDMSVDTVKLFTSYKDMDNTTYGMSKLTEQVAAFDKKAAAGDEYYHGTVVAGINASYYNMTTGKPSGVFVMNGNDVTGSERSAYFAVLKDGTVKIGNAGEYEADKGNIREALGIYKMLVFDGNIVLSDADKNNAQKYPRQTIGITEDNKVVILSADGNQEPESIGLTLLEQAQVMLDLGCKWAGHLDGGGSMTYGSKPEGEDSFKIVNKPSDGSERSISNGLIVVSTAVASKVFDHVSFNAETEYVTPGTSVGVSVAGVSSTGHAAEIPADITYKVTNGAYADGVLIANSVGDVVLTAVYNGKEVGSVTVHAVIPEKLAFNSSEMTVPFGKTVTLALTATYGLNEVKFKSDDVLFTLGNDGIGTISGLDFTAGDGSVAESQIHAAFIDAPAVSAIANIRLGKGSDVVFDFEDGDTSMFDLGYVKYNYTLPEGKVYPVTAANGKVHSGNGAMALDINYGNSLESGYMMTALQYTGDEKTFENATKLGMWIYISDEDVATWIRYTVYPLVLNSDGEYVKGSDLITNTLCDGVVSTTGFVNQYQEPGWHYLSIDLSAYKGLYLHQGYIVQFYISDRDGAAYDYYYNQHKSYNGRYVMYVDDITVDYSDAVDDREAPVFGDITYATGSMADAAVLNGQTVSENVLSFGVKVADNMKKSNYTGLNAATAKAYIDGVETACTYKDGIISVSDVVLADGIHHVKFSICDKQGNYASVIRKINVQANSGKSTIKVVAHDPSLDKILLGSVWYADIVAADIEKVQSVTVDIDLNNMSKWELDHMTVAAGFEASYSIQDDENIATITITRTGENTQTGEAVLASLPIRTWELKMGYTYTSGTMADSTAFTYAQFKSMKEFWPIDISMEIDRGLVTFVDGTTDTFSGEGPQVDTEMYKMAKDMISTDEGKAYYAAWNGGHIHTAEAVADKAATCTESGYTGRTYCEVCKSIVDWGTTVPATGHSYDFVDGVLKCKECGESYPLGTGLFTVNGKYYYVINGKLETGWRMIDNEWYFFQNDYSAAVGNDVNIDGYYYGFDDTGVLVSGSWADTDKGRQYMWAGYSVKKQFREIDGKTYAFDVNGYLYIGSQYIRYTHGDPYLIYDITEDGVVNGPMTGYTGIVKSSAGVFYAEDGIAAYAGLIKDEEGNYYYINSTLKAVKNCTYGIGAAKTNGLLPAGEYSFDADGKMIINTSKNGLCRDADGEIRYYVNGEEIYAGLVKDEEGNYYYINSTLKAVKNCTYGIGAARTNGLLPAGEYSFDADGKMIINTSKNGLCRDADGEIRYYVNGEEIYAGLVKDEEGNYYYINSTLKAVKNCTYGIGAARTNGLLPAGEYSFDADGKMIINTSKNGLCRDADGEIRYYVNGEEIYAGLVKDEEGNYYYINSTLKAVKNCTYGIGAARTNGLLPAGEYSFDADGKMIINK